MASEHDIIVVDDHPLFRRGVIQLLKMDPSFNVVAEAGDFEAAMVAAVSYTHLTLPTIA